MLIFSVFRLLMYRSFAIFPHFGFFLSPNSEFFERTILCNSLVWSCSFTGKSGLTYQEALECEKKVKKSLLSFPEPLAVPVLYLVTFNGHPKISDLCDDIYEYVKNRYFVGETVTVVRNSGAR